MFPSYIAKKWSSYVSYSINMKSVPSLGSVFVFEGIFLPSPMIPRQIQFCVCNLHILKGKWLPFQMIYVDCPRCTSESSDSPSNYRCFWESKSKVAYWNILAFSLWFSWILSIPSVRQNYTYHTFKYHITKVSKIEQDFDYIYFPLRVRTVSLGKITMRIL